MLEFIFFHQNICNIFTDYIATLNIEYKIKDEGDSIIGSVDEDQELWVTATA